MNTHSSDIGTDAQSAVLETEALAQQGFSEHGCCQVTLASKKSGEETCSGYSDWLAGAMPTLDCVEGGIVKLSRNMSEWA